MSQNKNQNQVARLLEEIQKWESNPITKQFKAILKADAIKHRSGLCSGSLAHDPQIATRYAYTVGFVSALEQVVDLDLTGVLSVNKDGEAVNE